MTHVDNAAAVQVGLALLLIALVAASTLLVLGVILQSIAHVRMTDRSVTQLAADAARWAEAVRTAFGAARTEVERTSERLDDLERRLTTQEPE